MKNNRAADLLNIPYSQCIAFEDSASGIKAALKAKMTCIGIGTEATQRYSNLTTGCVQDFRFLHTQLNDQGIKHLLFQTKS